MTVSTTNARVAYAGDGATTAFAVDFVFLDATDLEVIERDVATGAETTKTLTTHYTVTGGAGDIGTVSAVAAPPATVEWIIRRRTARTQLTNYVPNDAFPSRTHERAIDRAAMIDQEQDEELGRAVKLPPGEAGGAAAVLPSAQDRTNKFLAFDELGRPWAADSVTGAPATAFGAGLIGENTGQAALVRLGLRYFFPETYGAVGDGLTDDSAAVQAAVDAAAAAVGARGVVLLQRRYACATGISVKGSAITIEGVGFSSGLAAIGAASIYLLSAGYGVAGIGLAATGTVLAANVADGATNIQVVSAAAFTVGNWIWLQATDTVTGDAFTQLNQVVGIAGNMLSLAKPMQFGVVVASMTTDIRTWTPISNITIRNLELRNSGNTGTTVGLLTQWTLGLVVENVRTQGFSAPNGGGQVYGYGLGSVVSGAYDSESGSAGLNAIVISASTGIKARDVESYRSTGFGIGITQTCGSVFAGVISEDATGRGIKLSGACRNEFVNVKGNNSGSTGIALDSGSSWNRFTNVEAIGNNDAGAGSNQVGIWLNGENNRFNTFTNVTTRNNGVYNIVCQGSDEGNVFRDLRGDTADAYYFVVAGKPCSVSFGPRSYVRAKPSSALSLPNATVTTLLLATEISDENGEYNPDTGRFTASVPGLYHCHLRVQASDSMGVAVPYLSVNGVVENYYTMTNAGSVVEITSTLRLAAGDYIEPQIYQASGSTLTVSHQDYNTILEVTQL